MDNYEITRVRREKLEEIFRNELKVTTRMFVSRCRKNGLHIPTQKELGTYNLGVWLSDSISEGHLYDTDKDNDWISEWHDELFKQG